MPARRLFALSTLAACLLFAMSEASAANCAPDASVGSDCSHLVINNPNQTITIQAGARVNTPGTISVWFKPSATGTTFINNGTISSGSNSLFNQGTITSFVNHGVIESNIHFYNQGTIQTLTNLGTITGRYGAMYNTGPLTTLNNRQGGNSPMHFFSSLLPTNYNIIIDSPSVYGKLSASNSAGNLTFGIYNTSVVAPGTYEDVLTGIDASRLTTTTGSYDGLAWSLLYDGANYDLVFAPPGPTAQATLSSMQATAQGLRSAFGVQTAFLNPGLSYDCAMFDSKGLCVAATGRNTTLQGSNAGATSGIVTLAWRVQSHLRVGAYVEQTLDSSGDPSVVVRKGNPDLGVFAVWNQRADGDGPQVRVAHRQGQKKVDITRPVVAGSEPGAGTADLVSRGTQLTLSHGVRVNDTWRVSPYVGVRAIDIERSAYSEAASASVTMPLSYGKLSERSVVMLLGSHVAARLAPRFTLTGFAGVERDQSRKTSDYSASGVAALQPIDFGSNPKKTRPVASIGGVYDVDKTHQFSAQWVYRKEAFSSSATNSLLATYSVGF
jgi:hypothetical protein